MTDPQLNIDHHLKPRGPVGIGATEPSVRLGPCGIDDTQSTCADLSLNLFTVLLTSKEFSRVYNDVKGTGVKIVANRKLALREGGRGNRGAGMYDPIKGTIELPASIYSSSGVIRSEAALKLIAHEFYHAWQYRKLHKLSKGGSAEDRAKILAQSIERMGREKFIKSSMALEKKAEAFAVRIVLQLFRENHPGLQFYRREAGPITPEGYFTWDINTWWGANESLYREDAEIEWVRWMYRISEGDYKAELDKEALKRWLQQNPDIR